MLFFVIWGTAQRYENPIPIACFLPQSVQFILFSCRRSIAGKIRGKEQESLWSKALLEAKMYIYKNACDDANKIFHELEVLPYPSKAERNILLQLFKSDLLYCANNKDSARTLFNAIQIIKAAIGWCTMST
ncbi:MAG: hypothetical protein IPM91_01335 [Bacteroidetes bacterium]|nr:hypothetical protein [Bacteroidota bacterium]